MKRTIPLIVVLSSMLIWILPTVQTSSAQSPTYLGCGSVNDPIKCDGCEPGPVEPKCTCENNNCATDMNECPTSPNAFTLCQPPNSGEECYKKLIVCSWRWQCNNSAGMDLGDCSNPPHTCITSSEVVNGEPRWLYYCLVACTCTGDPPV